MRKLLTILFLLPLFVFGQPEGYITSVQVPGFDSIYVKAAIGFGAAAANRKVWINHWSGDATTSYSAALAQGPFNTAFVSGDMKKVLSPGDTVYYMVTTIRSDWSNCAHAVGHYDFVFANWLQDDTTTMMAEYRIIQSGYSGGGARMSQPLTGWCFGGEDYDRVMSRVKKYFTQATGTWAQEFDLQTVIGKALFWGMVDVDDALEGNSDNIYAEFLTYHGNTTSGIRLTKPVLSGDGHGIIDETFYAEGTDASDDAWWFAYDTLYSATPPLNKITGINWRDVVSMAGGFNPWTMFDEQTAIDPANGDVSPVPTTMSLPSGKNLYSIYQNSESRFYVKLRCNFDLTGVYLHAIAAGTYFGDTIKVYKGLHTPEDPLTEADVIATIYIAPGTAGWIAVPVSGANAQDVSIITFGFKGNPDATPGFETIATRVDITEIVLYGDQDGTRSPALPTTLTYAHRTNLTLKEKVGVNNGSGYIDMRTIPDSTKLRSLIDVGFIPGNNADWPSNTFNQNPFGDYPSLLWRTERYYWDSVARIKGGRVNPEFFHTTTRAESQGAGSEYWGVDNLGDNPDLPASYEIFADLGWHYAKMYGRLGVISDTLNYKTYGVPKYAGLDLIGSIGFDNESDYLSRKIDTASDNEFKYSSVYQTVVKASMFVDGHVGAYGPRLGVRTADTTVGIRWPGTIGLLGQRYHDLTTYIKDMRSDGTNYIKYANAHMYPNNEHLGVVPPYGIHPIEFGFRGKLQLWADSIHIIDSSMYKVLSEFGYDANDTLNVFRSQYAVPDTSSLTTREKQANLTAYDFFVVWASSVEEFDDFELFNNNTEDNNGSYQTSNDAKNLPSLTLMPKYYFKKQMIAIMGDYIHDSVISETWRVSMVYRGYNKYTPTTKCYVVALPNNGGLTGTISVHTGTGYTVTKYDMDYNSTTYTTSALTVDGSGDVSVTGASDKPFILIATPTGANVDPTANAGIDQSINPPTFNVTVNGSGSTDSDGTITTYGWTRISGPNTPTITNAANVSTTITGLIPGTYVFRLTVTDNDGGTDTDDITIIVTPYKIIHGSQFRFGQ